jgi:hypothetical protein
MKTVAYVIGVVLILIAIVYFVTPSDSLPSFMPGHVAGSAHVHVKHGISFAVAGVIVLAIGWFLGRRA